jgi:hypothetical protein
MYKLDRLRLLEANPSRNFSWTHYSLRLVDGHGDDGEVEGEAFLPAAAMDATALAHATSSRFIRFSSPQITGSTVRARFVSAARNTAAAPHADTSPSPPAAGNDLAISAPKSMAEQQQRSALGRA